MASYKNLSSDWYIDVNGGVGTIYIDGNLDVTGNITYVSEIAVNDAFIIVAANNTGTVTDMGLIAQKTGNTYAGLRFDTGTSSWQISPSVNADGSPNTAHTTNPVPCIIIDQDVKTVLPGKLADIAPTILKMMEIEIPEIINGDVITA
jgi:hypothetical protein